jgi:hypothetical protein
VSLLWNVSNGVAPVNVVHVQSATKDATEIGDLMDAAFEPEMFALVDSEYRIDQLAILPLDGTSATTIHNVVTDTHGAGTGGSLPAISAVLSFRTDQRGPRGRGRIYLGPLAESNVTNGIVGGDAFGPTTGAWEDFYEALNDDDVAGVVASYTHADAHLISAITMDNRAGTQRRRQDQLR